MGDGKRKVRLLLSVFVGFKTQSQIEMEWSLQNLSTCEEEARELSPIQG